MNKLLMKNINRERLICLMNYVFVIDHDFNRYDHFFVLSENDPPHQNLNRMEILKARTYTGIDHVFVSNTVIVEMIAGNLSSLINVGLVDPAHYEKVKHGTGYTDGRKTFFFIGMSDVFEEYEEIINHYEI